MLKTHCWKFVVGWLVGDQVLTVLPGCSLIPGSGDVFPQTSITDKSHAPPCLAPRLHYRRWLNSTVVFMCAPPLCRGRDMQCGEMKLLAFCSLSLCVVRGFGCVGEPHCWCFGWRAFHSWSEMQWWNGSSTELMLRCFLGLMVSTRLGSDPSTNSLCLC